MGSLIPAASNMRAHLERHGFVRIPGLFTADELNTFRAAAKAATELARSGKWPYLRTIPKQFPPWSSDPSQGIWGVQHLLHPEMPEQTTFAQSYFHANMIEVITRLLGCGKDELVLELYNMLVRPDRDFALRWHRDDIAPDISVEEELERLNEPMLHAQWNLALYDDASLIVVPGSHRRARTDMERNADPYEDDMPGQTIVKMNAGDIMFYNNNILHRGVYDSKAERMTLHGTMGVVGSDPARARNILQHGIGEWAAKADFSGLPGEMAELAASMQQRLLEVGRHGNGDVGFSQTD